MRKLEKRSHHIRAWSTVIAGIFVAGLVAVGVQPADAAEAHIHCDLQVNNPHHSGHKPGTTNVTATVKCTGIVESLWLRVWLYRADGSATNYSTVSNTGNSQIGGNTSLPCVNGKQYWAAGNAVIVAPPGFKPDQAILDYSTGIFTVPCDATADVVVLGDVGTGASLDIDGSS